MCVCKSFVLYGRTERNEKKNNNNHRLAAVYGRSFAIISTPAPPPLFSHERLPESPSDRFLTSRKHNNNNILMSFRIVLLRRDTRNEKEANFVRTNTINNTRTYKHGLYRIIYRARFEERFVGTVFFFPRSISGT